MRNGTFVLHLGDDGDLRQTGGGVRGGHWQFIAGVERVGTRLSLVGAQRWRCLECDATYETLTSTNNLSAWKC